MKREPRKHLVGMVDSAATEFDQPAAVASLGFFVWGGLWHSIRDRERLLGKFPIVSPDDCRVPKNGCVFESTPSDPHPQAVRAN